LTDTEGKLPLPRSGKAAERLSAADARGGVRRRFRSSNRGAAADPEAVFDVQVLMKVSARCWGRARMEVGELLKPAPERCSS